MIGTDNGSKLSAVGTNMCDSDSVNKMIQVDMHIQELN